MQFCSKSINTLNHFLLGYSWTFHQCSVMMTPEGFICDCQKKPKYKCDHIKSIEMALLGVREPKYKVS